MFDEILTAGGLTQRWGPKTAPEGHWSMPRRFCSAVHRLELNIASLIPLIYSLASLLHSTPISTSPSDLLGSRIILRESTFLQRYVQRRFDGIKGMLTPSKEASPHETLHIPLLHHPLPVGSSTITPSCYRVKGALSTKGINRIEREAGDEGRRSR